MFTVEVITNANNIIVNQAHAGGTTTKSLRAETADAVIRLISKWHNAELGLGQGVVSVLASRSKNVGFTNSSGRSIVVYTTLFNAANNDLTFLVDDITIITIDQNPVDSIINSTVIVPNGSTYQVSSPGMTLSSWSELR